MGYVLIVRDDWLRPTHGYVYRLWAQLADQDAASQFYAFAPVFFVLFCKLVVSVDLVRRQQPLHSVVLLLFRAFVRRQQSLLSVVLLLFRTLVLVC